MFLFLGFLHIEGVAYHQCYEYHSLRIVVLDSCHHCETWAMHIIYVCICVATVWSSHAGRIPHMTYSVARFSIVAIWTSNNNFMVCICPDGASSYTL